MKTGKTRGKALLISVTALILALVALFALFSLRWSRPYTYHRANIFAKTQTHDRFLPSPDTVVYQGKWTHHFSGEDRKKLLGAFELIFANWDYISAIATMTTPELLEEFLEKYGALEFRYSAKQVCSVAPNGWGDTAEYDAVWVFLNEGEPYIVRVRSGSARGSVLGLCGLPQSVGQEYARILKEVFSNYSFQTAEWLKAS